MGMGTGEISLTLDEGGKGAAGHNQRAASLNQGAAGHNQRAERDYFRIERKGIKGTAENSGAGREGLEA